MRLLIVEDDIRLATLLRQGLKEQGFAVDLAGDVPVGLRLALAADYGESLNA